jgi:hypothetical protein
MKQFEEIKKEILERAHNARACTIQYKRAYQSENLETLCNVIKDNFWWCCRNNVLDGELIDKYKKIFSDNKIYHNVSIKSGFLLASGNSTVEASGNSTVKAYDNSTVKASGNSTVKASGNSTVQAYGNSTVKAYDNSTVEASGNSTVQASGNSTVEAYDNSTVQAYGNSTVQAYGNSTVKAYDNSYINCRSTIECVLKDNSIVRKWDTNTIQYVSDNLKFEKKY